MSIEITKGSKEYLVVDIDDKLANLTDLLGTNPTYDITDGEGGTITGNSGLTAVIDGTTAMRLLCMVDAGQAVITPGRYNLYVDLTSLPEAPRLGPFKFMVTD